jgi:hypothetical protein
MSIMMEETALPVAAETAAAAPSESTFYQIDFCVDNVGKHFQNPSKKRVSWRFARSTSRRATTPYHVVLTWSKRTGKQHIEMNGSEVHESRQKGSSIVTHQWTTNAGTMALHLIASRASPKNIPNLRKYELMVNGIPFSSLPFRNGTSPSPQVTSIVTILYPDGYNATLFKDDPIVPLPSTVDKYQEMESLNNQVTAR